MSVTIPAGTGNGSHTVYAIGSGGDQASAAITVNAPKVTASVIGKSAGGRTGRIRQGGTYRIFANVSGSGGPARRACRPDRQRQRVTTGQTAVPMTYGSYTRRRPELQLPLGDPDRQRDACRRGRRPTRPRLTDNGGTVNGSTTSR